MRRTLAVLSIATATALLAQPAAAQLPESVPEVESAPVPADLPDGFTDGIPVGGDEIPPVESVDPDAGFQTRAAPAGEALIDRAPPGPRYFGAGAWEAIEQAAAATPRTCGLTNAGLTALIAAPVFKESSAATTPSTAPSPMTLSRYDEWNGTYATTSNRSANYTLYEARNPNTPYARAFWHPGIGIWQYDSAGVGAPFTAVERMDVRTVAGDIAVGMARRYCNPVLTTNAARRHAAWQPWWTGLVNCPACQEEFDNMMSTTPQFARINKVPGISATGGAARRTCQIGGTSVECWYVNPSVGVIQGATAWATINPSGGSPTVAPTPLSRPFYVIKRGGYEERHWLRADTGYAVDISARRRLGQNARVRSGQPSSGLSWSRTSGLCDITTGRGQCAAVPPPSGDVRSSLINVSGTYNPVVGDFNGDGISDVLWYGPGSAPDSMWNGAGSGQFTSASVNVSGTWTDVFPADINGDGRDDVVFYHRGTGEASLWVWNSTGGFRSQRINPGPNRQPLVGDFDGSGTQDILWYGPGPLSDSKWSWSGGGVRVTAMAVNGTYRPIVGDFDGDGIDDIFWYGPGSAPDSLWLNRRGGGPKIVNRSVSGTYDPVVGDFDGDGRDDIAWIDRGGTSRVWFAFVNNTVVSQTFVVTQPYRVVVADLQNDGRDDIFWYDPSGSGQLWTRWTGGRGRNSVPYQAPASLQPLTGAFSGPGRDGIFWYGPGSLPDAVWWR